mgnify:CR=1 FL=1
MKKTTIIAVAAFLGLTAAVNAQTTPDTTTKPVTTEAPAEAPVSKDKYNNWSPDTYKLQPMPEALTTEKVFPVIGSYQLTDKDGNATPVTITLDETNKGIAWIDGFPQGRIKANLMKSPATYKIPAQKIGEGKDAKDVAEGVLVYNRDANTMNICFNCTYKSENPEVVFTATTEEPVVEETAATKKAAKSTAKTSKKVVKVQPVHYTGSKLIQTNAAVQQ